MKMGLFGFLKKSSAQAGATQNGADNPYKDNSANVIYNLLFCDNLGLYKANVQTPYSYPFDVLFSETRVDADLQKIIDDTSADPRTRVLAYNKLLSTGKQPANKELLAVMLK